MSDSKAALKVRTEGEKLVCVIEVFDQELVGKPAKLKIFRKVEVRESRGITGSDEIEIADIPAIAARQEIEVPRESLKAFTYRGKNISIDIGIRMSIDDGVIFDTTIDEAIEIAIGTKPSVSENAQVLVEPEDAFCFVTNFKAIPHVNRVITIVLAIVGGIVIAVNSWIGWHDETVPAGNTYFYRKYDSDGDKHSPLMKSLMASGSVGAMVAAAIRGQLRKYMRFDLGRLPDTIRFGDRIAASELITGRARIPLSDIVVRVIACNFEKGQYKRGTGSQERTVSFDIPVRAVVLYEKKVKYVAPKMQLSKELDGEIDFSAMFRALYPPQGVGSTHGLTVHWEVQLIHNQLMDQEIVCPSEVFRWEDFRKS